MEDRKKRTAHRKEVRDKNKQNDQNRLAFKDAIDLFIEQQNLIMKKLEVVQANQVVLNEKIELVGYRVMDVIKFEEPFNYNSAKALFNDIGDVIGPKVKDAESDEVDEVAELPGLEQTEPVDEKA